MLEQLRVPFPASQVRKNQDNLDYVAIDGYINRLLDVLGLNYSFIITNTELSLLPEDMSTRSGKRQYLAQVTAELQISDTAAKVSSVRSGTGADVSHDPDKAVKTAQAEALKKAAHQFGIALELWDADHRALLEKQRKLVGATDATLKQEVFKLGRERTGKDKPTAAQLAKVFGVEPAALTERETLEQILREEGLL